MAQDLILVEADAKCQLIVTIPPLVMTEASRVLSELSVSQREAPRWK